MDLQELLDRYTLSVNIHDEIESGGVKPGEMSG